jgi:FkbM family methyltransferase
MTRPKRTSKPLAARIYRRTANIVEPILPPGLRSPAHYLSRRLTHRLEAEYDAIMSMVSPGQTAIDVGANIGIYTYGFLARGADVHAIEPQAACASLIQSYYDLGFPFGARGGRGKLSVHVEAVSDVPGTAVLYVPVTNGKIDDESASLNPDGGESIRIEVPVRTIDSYELPNVRVIKMDVEGREISAIEGAAKTFARCRPVLLVEIEQRHHKEPIADVFARINAVLGPRYETKFLGRGGLFEPFSNFDVVRHQLSLSDNLLSKDYVRNFFFLPT